ncbi:hypothetical protein E2320_014403 [Naja naja]|nr:hypothetical protein E2320_014403 [Naja naja]
MEGSAPCLETPEPDLPEENPKSGIRSSLPPGGGEISWEEEGRPGGRRESSLTCPERDPEASRGGCNADPPRKKRESRREMEI